MKTVADFVAFAKARTGAPELGDARHRHNLASDLRAVRAKGRASNSSTSIIAARRRRCRTLVAGLVDVAFDNVGAARALIKAGTLRALGLATEKPTGRLPRRADGQGDRAGLCGGDLVALVAPPKVPQPIVSRLNADINEALRDPDAMKRLANFSSADVAGGIGGRDRGVLQGRDRDFPNVIKTAKCQARAIV